MDFHCRVVFMRVNKIKAMYDLLRENVKVERGSTFTFTRDLPYMRHTQYVLFSNFHMSLIVTIFLAVA